MVLCNCLHGYVTVCMAELVGVALPDLTYKELKRSKVGDMAWKAMGGKKVPSPNPQN